METKALQESCFHQIILSFICERMRKAQGFSWPKVSKLSYNITALQRGLRLLQLFSESSRGLTAKQVATLSRLPASTVHPQVRIGYPSTSTMNAAWTAAV